MLIGISKKSPRQQKGLLMNDILINVNRSVIFRPEEIEGLQEGWVYVTYGHHRFDHCQLLGTGLNKFTGGKLVVNIAEMPIKCPVAPFDFAFLADSDFHKRGIRDQVVIVFQLISLSQVLSPNRWQPGC